MHRNTIKTGSFSTLSLLAALAVSLPAAAASVTFTNASDNDITNSANWGGTTPAFGGAITDRLNFKGTTTYGAAQGTSTFNDGSGEARSFSIDDGGQLTVTGGTINVAPGGSGSSFITNGSNDSGTLIINGGTVNFGGEDLIMIFNGGNSTATYTINSGSMTLDQFKGNNGDAGSVVNFNFNGGTTNFRKISLDGDETGVMNFNGGTLSPTSSSFVTSGTPNFGNNGGDLVGNVLAGGFVWDTNALSGHVNLNLVGSVGDGGVTVTGGGSLGLNGDNSHTGTTVVTGATLQIRSATGLGTTDGNTQINAGGHLRGLAGNYTVEEAIVFDTNSLVDTGWSRGGNSAWTQNGDVTLTSDLRINIDGGSTIAIAGGLAGAGDITKVGSGRLNINTDTTWAGTINLEGGVIGGNGSTDGALLATGGTVAAGESIGVLGFDSANIDGTLSVQYDGNTVDLLEIVNELDITDATINFSLNTGGDPIFGDGLVFATYGTLVGEGSVTLNNTPEGYTVDYNYQDGNQIALVLIPEPSSLALLGLGGLMIARRRRA